MSSSVEINTESQSAAPITNKSSRLRRIGLTLLLALVVGALLVPKKLYTETIVSKLTAMANASGYRITLKEPTLSGLGISAREAEVFVPAALSVIQLQALEIRARPLSIATGRLKIDLTATIFSGQFRAAIHLPIWADSTTFEGALTDVKLSSIPQLRSFGVESGKLSIQTQSGSFKSSADKSLSGLELRGLDLKVEKLTKTQDTFLQLPRKLGGGYLAIPAVSDLGVRVQGEAAEGILSPVSISGDSSLGSFLTKGVIPLVPSAPINLIGSLNLSEQALSKFGAFIALASGNSISPSDRELEFRLEGQINRPQIKLSPRRGS